MKNKSVAVGLLSAMLINLGPVIAVAQPVERLVRPVPSSTTNPGGKVVVSRDATFGNMVVDQYATLGRTAATPDANPFVVRALTDMNCSGGAISSLSAYAVSTALKGLDKATRAGLKTRDVASMTALAAGAIATLDGVSANAILADEAISPGAYHDAVAGMRLALEACNFFGLKRKL